MPDSIRTQSVAPGVTYEYRWYAAGPWAVHVVIVDPRACGVDLRTIKAGGHVIGREPTSMMARRAESELQRDVLAATNADFFSYEPPGVSEGPQISNGVLIKSEGTHREAIEDRMVRLQPVFAITRDRKSLLRYTQFSGSVRFRSITVALGGVNVRPRADRAVIFNALWGEATPVDTGSLELVLRGAGRSSRIGGSGVVVAVDTAAAGVAIPADGFVVLLRGAARGALSQIQAGDTLRWSGAFAALPANVTELVAGYPMLLLGGRAVHHDEAGLRTTFSDRRHPRSAIARDRNGRIHIFAIDGRKPGYSEGMSLQELGEYLLAHGFRDALNLDGGGSATLVVDDRIVNRPADANGERAVSNALLVLGPRPGECR